MPLVSNRSFLFVLEQARGPIRKSAIRRTTRSLPASRTIPEEFLRLVASPKPQTEAKNHSIERIKEPGVDPRGFENGSVGGS